MQSSVVLAGAGLDLDRLAHIIAAHSDKGQACPDLCCAILMDADVLDMIGAMSIAMHISKLDGHSAFFFHDICQILLGREMEYCAGQRMLLNTPAAVAMLDQKQRFIGRFAAQLRRELRRTA
ncbi:MAG: hypothetical protein Q8P31_04005 [Bacillota bacterium]|nr:hypothetical protein [Bacillota bacterium]